MNENQDKKNTGAVRKQGLFLPAIILLITLTALILGYFFYEKMSKELGKNIQNEIIEESEEELAEELTNLDGENVEEEEVLVKEDGFLYQSLIDQQKQISKLNVEINNLRAEINKSRNQSKLNKIILTYVDLRRSVFSGEKYRGYFKEFEVLVASDRFLKNKTKELKRLLPKFITDQKLNSQFQQLIPKLIQKKNHKDNPDWLDKILQKANNLVIIRQIEKKPKMAEIDNLIIEIEKNLANQNYQSAFNKVEKINDKYKKVLERFYNNLQISINVQEIDITILDYLKKF